MEIMTEKTAPFYLNHARRILPFLLLLTTGFFTAELQAAPICNITSSNRDVCTFLQQKYAEGSAAGNVGDYYDNCDRGHAYLRSIADDHPQISTMSTTYGFQGSVIPGKIVIGNASMVWLTSTGPDGGTESFNFSTMVGRAAASMCQQYIHNNHYWYPEHHDHDAKDHHPSMWPYISVSQGSSGSELDEVKKWFFALAAFRPDVKATLKDKGLLMPVLQMITRMTRAASDQEYLSGKVHQNAYDNFTNTLAMVQLANAILPTNIPPFVQIKVLDDTYKAVNGRDFYENSWGQDNEFFYDSPASVARIWHGHEYTKKITVSAAESYDLNNRPLIYQWAVLRGDPQHVRIRPLNGSQSVVEIEIDYHPETVIEGSTRLTNLVVVGAFVHNGVYYSAPAFVTSFSLANETREYDPSTHRLFQVTYSTSYVHPSISTDKSWTSDTFQYGSDGRGKGWTRLKNGQMTEWTKEGFLVVEKDASGSITKAQKVTYVNDSSGKLTWQNDGSPFTYVPGNEPPLVEAGEPQTVRVNTTIQLNGTVTDDGLPNPPRQVTISWSQISGPGRAVFENTDVVNAKVKFTDSGDYRLRLSADDGQQAAYDDVVITVNSDVTPGPNGVPQVRAGPDQTVSLAVGAQLHGNAIDDGLPMPPGLLTTSWSQVSGPGSVVFDNPSLLDTTARFSALGVYVLRLTAFDGQNTGSDDLVVTVLIEAPPNAGAPPSINLIDPTKNQNASISFALPQAGSVNAVIYTMRGEKIKELAGGELPAGNNTLPWDGRNESGQIVAAGVYVVVVKGAGQNFTKKIVVLK